VERYCVWPGQACSYMIGQLAWLRLRAQSGAVPLEVLDRVMTT
jgi:uncharacterized protein (DUF885 family)